MSLRLADSSTVNPCRLAVCVALVLSVHPHAAKAIEHEGARELIDRLENWFNSNRAVEFEAKTVSRMQGGSFTNKDVISSERTCLRADRRWKVLTRDNGATVVQGQTVPASGGYEYVIGSDQLTYVQNDGDGKYGVVVAFSSDAPGVLSVFYYLRESAFVFGFMNCNSTTLLPEVLRQSASIVEPPADDERDPGVAVIKATGKFGKVRVVLDGRSGAPRKVVINKAGNDLYNGKPITQIGPGEKGGIYPAESWRTAETVVDDIIYDESPNPTLKQFTETRTVHYSGGSVVRTQTVVRYEQFVHDPPINRGAFEVTSPIADGTSVTVLGADAINYEWQQGKVVQKFDAVAARKHAKVEFQRGFRSHGYVFVVSALAVIIVGLFGLRTYLASRG